MQLYKTWALMCLLFWKTNHFCFHAYSKKLWPQNRDRTNVFLCRAAGSSPRRCTLSQKRLAHRRTNWRSSFPRAHYLSRAFACILPPEPLYSNLNRCVYGSVNLSSSHYHQTLKPARSQGSTIQLTAPLDGVLNNNQSRLRNDERKSLTHVECVDVEAVKAKA